MNESQQRRPDASAPPDSGEVAPAAPAPLLTTAGARLWLLLHVVMGPGQENCACHRCAVAREVLAEEGTDDDDDEAATTGRLHRTILAGSTALIVSTVELPHHEEGHASDPQRTFLRAPSP